MFNRIMAAVKQHAIPIVLVALAFFFSLATDTFLTLYNIRNIFIQCSFTIIAGIGLTFVLISGGIDLSMGFMMSLIGIITGLSITQFGMPPAVGVSMGIFLGIVLGFINGVLVVRLKVFPLIVTLATAAIFQGISYIISQSQTVIGFPESFVFIGQGYIWEIPFPVILTVIVVVVASFVLGRTYFGRYVYGIGGNEEAVKLAGVNVDRIRMALYTICGFFVSIASIVLISRSGSASSNMGPGIEFTCLTAGILGGISFKGGEGKVSGMVIGILLLTVLGNGMQLMQLGAYPQYIAKGVVLIAAVGFDTYQRKAKLASKRVT
jgi:ribose/xylose/arabinose/galactoside ABC-type transport system permease subunit